MRPRARLAALALGASLAGIGAARADSGPVPLRRIALGELGGWIELTATLDGRNGRWLLDTGASRNLVSPALARQLGLEPAGTVRAETPLGAVQGGEVALPPLSVGRYERRDQRALVIEPARLLGPAGDGIDGVLGVPWLAGQRAELDLRRWAGRFGSDDSSPCPEALEPVALTRHRGLPVITLATGERYVLDSGNPAGLVRIEAEAPGPATPGIVLAGEMRLTVLPEAALGSQRRSDVPVLRLTQPALHRALGDAARGLAGTALLDGARWALDLARDRLCVEGGRFATPGGFGLVPERAGDMLRIQHVLPGGPAERAGLRAGDPIAQWAGLPASSPLATLWQALQGSEELTLGVGEPVRELTLRRAIFAPPAP
jgi:hypothetical protein